jgi:flavodoxin
VEVELNMINKILYFTRTGNSKRIAEKLQAGLNSEIIEITDNKKWKGIPGFIFGGFHSSTWKQTKPVIYTEKPIKEDDTLLVISPVWANNCVPAVFSLYLSNTLKTENSYLLLVNDGSDTSKAFEKIEGKLGIFKGTYSITKSLSNEESVIENIIKTLKK